MSACLAANPVECADRDTGQKQVQRQGRQPLGPRTFPVPLGIQLSDMTRYGRPCLAQSRLLNRWKVGPVARPFLGSHDRIRLARELFGKLLARRSKLSAKRVSARLEGRGQKPRQFSWIVLAYHFQNARFHSL